MSSNNCEHKEWMALPFGRVGFVPTIWECTECGLRMAAGEYELFKTLRDQVAILRQLVELQKAKP